MYFNLNFDCTTFLHRDERLFEIFCFFLFIKIYLFFHVICFPARSPTTCSAHCLLKKNLIQNKCYLNEIVVFKKIIICFILLCIFGFVNHLT